MLKKRILRSVRRQKLASKSGQLEHHFGNKVGAARMAHMANDTSGLHVNQVKFILGLKRAIKRNPQQKGITNEHLKEMIRLAEAGPWIG